MALHYSFCHINRNFGNGEAQSSMVFLYCFIFIIVVLVRERFKKINEWFTVWGKTHFGKEKYIF